MNKTNTQERSNILSLIFAREILSLDLYELEALRGEIFSLAWQMIVEGEARHKEINRTTGVSIGTLERMTRAKKDLTKGRAKPLTKDALIDLGWEKARGKTGGGLYSGNTKEDLCL